MSAFCPEGCSGNDACVVGYPCERHPAAPEAPEADGGVEGLAQRLESLFADAEWDWSVVAEFVTGDAGYLSPTEVAVQIDRARAEGAREAVKRHQSQVELLRDWKVDGLLHAALTHAIEQYAGPDDDTIPVLRSWLERASTAAPPAPQEPTS